MKYLRKFNESFDNNNLEKDLILKYFNLVKMDLVMEYNQYITDMFYKTITSIKETHNIKEFFPNSLSTWLFNKKEYTQIVNFKSLGGSNVNIQDLYHQLINDDIKLSFCMNSDIEFDKDYMAEIVNNGETDEYEKRYEKYFKKIFQKQIKDDDFEIYTEVGFRTNSNIIYFHIVFILNKPIIFDIFKEPIKAITKYPTLVNYMYNYVSDEDFYDLVNKYPNEIKDILKDNALLKYTKHSKKHDDPDRFDMEENNYCYLLLCKDKFTENEDGTYIKDLEIESILKIDPYDKEEYGHTLMGMKMRARFQEGLSLNILWLPKGYDIDYDEINSDVNLKLRNSIRETMEEIR